MNDVQTAAISNIGKDLGISDLVDQIIAEADTMKEKLDAEGVQRKSVEEPVEAEQQSAPSDATPALDISATVKAIADTLQLDSLSEMIGELNTSIKAQHERLAALETVVNRTEEERKAILADEMPRYAWDGFKASEAPETVTKDVKTAAGPTNPVVAGLVGMMQRQA